ncbi:hypothetical protein VMCG_02503 [Cytospora schulzeri]|uniref:Uncharacterized protein n=1 Tax=Cytospora schulzeri TaxID=448051 RepID=A0A423X1T0_9PEZI|nr:hypothetical protein VMCG_02503 [Valsa malicola]
MHIHIDVEPQPQLQSTSDKMDSTDSASKQDSSKFINSEVADTETALQNSRSSYELEVLERNKIAKQFHNADLFKTQQSHQGHKDGGDVLAFINFPEFTSTGSCTKTKFPRFAVVQLTRDEVLSTGSSLLRERLDSETYQRRVKQAAGPLPNGIKYVLDLSPSTEEDEYTVALQRLSITTGVKLWYRTVAIGVSVDAVAGHDDSCGCNERWDDPYLIDGPPASIRGATAISSFDIAAYLFDTGAWTIDQYRNIDEFCPVRQGANLLRLFRSLADKDLHIDSAPRLWTLVGLFGMFEMTNYNLLRDQVTAWFNDGNNFAFVELLPEETIRIGTILKAPALYEPAFRILVNERALAIAGGNPRQTNKTIFNRKISDCLNGTEDMEKIVQKIEHAGVAMAERYKMSIDNLCTSDTLTMLGVQEWVKLMDVGRVIPAGEPVSASYKALMRLIRLEFRLAVEHVLQLPARMLPTDVRLTGKYEDIDAALTFSVPKNELDCGKSFRDVYATLNKAQRALCPLVWLGLRDMNMGYFQNLERIRRAALRFAVDFEDAKKQGKLYPGSYTADFDTYDSKFYDDILKHALVQLRNYVMPMVSRSEVDFHYALTPHMVLCLSEREMGYCRYEDETAYEASIPEAEFGPSGPGPAFRTGTTVFSVTDSIAEAMEEFTVNSDDDVASTVVGSEMAQDGISTVYDRSRVIAQSASVMSETFTDVGMSAAYAEAVAVPVGEQMPDQTAENIDDDDIYGASDLDSESEFELEDDVDDDDDGNDSHDTNDAHDTKNSQEAHDLDAAHGTNETRGVKAARDADNTHVVNDTDVRKEDGANDDVGPHDYDEVDEDDDIEVISLPDSDVSGYL